MTSIIAKAILLSFLVYVQALIPTHLKKQTASLAFVQNNRSLRQIHADIGIISSLRGGSDEYDSEYDSDEDLEESEEASDEEESDDEQDSENDAEIDEEMEDEEEDDDEDEDDTEFSNLPVKVTLKTNLSGSVLIDQSIEITASPSRTVQSLKQSVSRQFKSRPPMEAVVLRLDGQVLDDETIVSDLVDEEDEDEDDEDEDDDGLPKLIIIVDMIPPVDPKFGTEMKQRLDDMTNEEVFEAYISNLAAMHQNSLDLMQPEVADVASDEDDEGDEDEEIEKDVPNTNLLLQQYAMMLKDQISKSFTEEQKELLEKSDTPSSPEEDDLDNYSGDLLLKESIKRKKRRGGATANVKRTLQKNLNINWPDTIRNFFLFLFFGYFGGRNAMSRTIMLLGAPACFVIQARPVKVAIKQLFYTIGEPPGILLSLLPAPQQAIMSCDFDSSLKSVYGDDIVNYNDVVDKNSATSLDEDKLYDDSDDEDIEEEYDDSYDEYDDDY